MLQRARALCQSRASGADNFAAWQANVTAVFVLISLSKRLRLYTARAYSQTPRLCYS